jgi:hypothetical protein
MKARNREINIFNMSLLDILCGALGAFCFMMLVLFPFYTQDKGKPSRPDIPEGIDPKTFEEAKARIRELEDTLKKYKDYGEKLEAENKRLQAENRQLKQQNQEASKKMDQLEYRNPFIAMMDLAISKDDEVELYVEDNRANPSGHKTEKADLKRRQGASWNGDMVATSPAGGAGYFVIRDGPPGEYRLMLKVMKHSGAPISGSFIVDTAERTHWISVANISQSSVVIPIAVVNVDKDYHQQIRMTVPAEYVAPTQRPRIPPSEDKKK